MSNIHLQTTPIYKKSPEQAGDFFISQRHYTPHIGLSLFTIGGLAVAGVERIVDLMAIRIGDILAIEA